MESIVFQHTRMCQPKLIDKSSHISKSFSIFTSSLTTCPERAKLRSVIARKKQLRYSTDGEQINAYCIIHIDGALFHFHSVLLLVEFKRYKRSFHISFTVPFKQGKNEIPFTNSSIFWIHSVLVGLGLYHFHL